MNYYQNTMIQNYYLDITDFNYNNSQIILQGENAFFRLISEDTKNVIHKNTRKIQKKSSIQRRLLMMIHWVW